MQFVAGNVEKVELNSTSATVARNVAGKVSPYVWAFSKCAPLNLPFAFDLFDFCYHSCQ